MWRPLFQNAMLGVVNGLIGGPVCRLFALHLGAPALTANLGGTPADQHQQRAHETQNGGFHQGIHRFSFNSGERPLIATANDNAHNHYQINSYKRNGDGHKSHISSKFSTRAADDSQRAIFQHTPPNQ
jgi:hypothetical protein